MESLTALNRRFCSAHWELHDTDVEKANKLIMLIERSRSKERPQSGDIVIYTDKYGRYHAEAHIEHDRYGMGGNVCESGGYPHVTEHDNGELWYSTSGGPWCDIDLGKMKYVGTAKKTFWAWGHCGACADGGIDFKATVNVWEYKDPKCGKYTTKEYDQFYLYDSGNNSKRTKESGYRYHVGTGAYNYRAFADKEGLDAWLRTFRGIVIDRGERNNAIVWTWKNIEHHVAPSEFDKIDAPVDTMKFNGTMRKCKRIYDEENHTVNTYFVWYWKGLNNYRLQNGIKDKVYSYSWEEHIPEYIVARGLEVT